MNKCLFCYDEVENNKDFHRKCSQKIFGTPVPPVIEYSFHEMGQLAKNVIERSIAVPGVQPKLSMSLIKETKNDSDNRLTVVGALGGQYIFKPPSEKFREMPANEHVTMRIAEAFGINVVPSSLIRLASGELSYITKRIDRESNGEKIHMIDMFQITEAYDKYKGSMEKIGKALNNYSDNPRLDKLLFFEITLFSFLTGNNDMHLKNFSMIKTNSKWTLSPAYDLLNVSVVLSEDKDELALTISGKKRKLTLEDFNKLGTELDLTPKQIKGAYRRMSKSYEKAISWINNSFLSEEKKKEYKNLILLRCKQLQLGQM